MSSTRTRSECVSRSDVSLMPYRDATLLRIVGWRLTLRTVQSNAAAHVVALRITSESEPSVIRCANHIWIAAPISSMWILAWVILSVSTCSSESIPLANSCSRRYSNAEFGSRRIDSASVCSARSKSPPRARAFARLRAVSRHQVGRERRSRKPRRTCRGPSWHTLRFLDSSFPRPYGDRPQNSSLSSSLHLPLQRYRCDRGLACDGSATRHLTVV